MSLRRRRWLGLGLVYFAVYSQVEPGVVTRPYLLMPRANSNVAEGKAFLQGQVELEERTYDAALFKDRAYNVFPPLFSLVSCVALKGTPDGVPNIVLIFLLLVPMPGLTYLLLIGRTQRVRMAVLLSIGYLLGTSLWPVINRGLQEGDVWFVNHLYSQVGLLIFLVDYVGRRRIWLGALGLLIAAWSRQLSLFYLLPLLYAASVGFTGWPRRVRLAMVGFTTGAIVALPATLNLLKFGDPLDSGYRHIYEGRWEDRSDWPAQSAKDGLFGLGFVPRNLYHMNLGLPILDEPLWLIRFVPNVYGTGIWWTTPILLFLVIDWKRIWADQLNRSLLLAAFAVFAALMLYHTTGYAQAGYNRFSLDFMPVLLAVVAPVCDSPRRRGLSLAMVLWSVWYFVWVVG